LNSSILRFGEFELDPAGYELRKRGRRVKLQRIPMELLLLLARRPGELVLRADLSRVWDSVDPSDAERNINTAVRKIRQALGDDAERPRFVETVPGKGYRFIAPVSLPTTGRDAVPEGSAETGGLAPGRKAALAWYAVPILGSLAMAGVALWGPETQSMEVAPFTALSGSESTPAFSPDGARVAFSWAREGQGRHIYIKAVAGGPERQLTEGPGADSYPAWSPDGRFIAFQREFDQHGLELRVIAAAGGGERKIQTLSGARRSRISWTAYGKALAVADSDSRDTASGIFLISIATGSRQRITTPPAGSQGDWQPAFSPDGRRLAFLRNEGSFQIATLNVMPVDRAGMPVGKAAGIQTDRKDLTGVEWSDDSRSLICAALGALVRIPVTGGAAQQLPFQDATDASVARRGRLLTYTHSIEQTALVRVPGPGQPGAITRLITSSRFNGAPKYSPYGKHIVFMSDRTGADELWVTDSEGQNARQLTSFGRATVGSPRWSPDSRWIAFDSTADGHAKIYVIAAESGKPRRITSGDSSDVRPSWSQDGARIYFGSNRSGVWEIWKASPEGQGLQPVTHEGGREAFEDPEGKFLYYVKAAPTAGIWRMPAAGGGTELVCDRGWQGHWEIGRRGLYYLNPENQLELRELPTGVRIVIPTPGFVASASGGLLGIAPEDRWLLVTMQVQSETDLSLVRNFR
jgi:Tol biopolymer transport system component/DNA-binding winged helix-turn-helix (wHTH) protein